MAETSVLVLEADYVDPTYTVYGTYYDLTGAVLSTFEVDTTSYGPPLVSEYLTGYRDRRLVASRENIACFFAGNYIVSYIDGNVYAFDFGIIDPSATGKTIKVLENGFFGALVNDDGAYFYISEDGINWTLQNTDPLGDSIDGSIQDVYYSDAENRYYLVSTYSEMASGEVIRTEDFVIFEDSVFGETDANTAGEELFCIYGNTVFVNPTATDPLMAYSVNGGTASTTAIVGLPSNTYRYYPWYFECTGAGVLALIVTEVLDEEYGPEQDGIYELNGTTFTRSGTRTPTLRLDDVIKPYPVSGGHLTLNLRTDEWYTPIGFNILIGTTTTAVDFVLFDDLIGRAVTIDYVGAASYFWSEKVRCFEVL